MDYNNIVNLVKIKFSLPMLPKCSTHGSNKSHLGNKKLLIVALVKMHLVFIVCL